MAYRFYIFLITGNFTTNNALKQSFNIMNLRFNFTSNKSLLINYLFSPNGWKRSFSTRSHIRGVIPCYKKNIKKVSRYSRGKSFVILPIWKGLNIPSNDRSINCNNNRILWYHRTYLKNQKRVFSCWNYQTITALFDIKMTAIATESGCQSKDHFHNERSAKKCNFKRILALKFVLFWL